MVLAIMRDLGYKEILALLILIDGCLVLISCLHHRKSVMKKNKQAFNVRNAA